MKPKQLSHPLLSGTISGSSFDFDKEVAGPFGVVGSAKVRAAVGGATPAEIYRIKRIGPIGVALRHSVIAGTPSIVV